MATNVKKKVFFLVFCLASVTQGMYSTYFVSILTTIERIYQIQSKTAGAIMSATEIGQIVGSLVIAYYGGRGNTPKWIAGCMTLTAVAALISTSPHFILSKAATNSRVTDSMFMQPYLTSDLSTVPSLSSVSAPSLLTSTQKANVTQQYHLCHSNDIAELQVSNLTQTSGLSGSMPPLQNSSPILHQEPTASVLVIFFLSLLAIGFGSTALTTLGIPYIDDIVSKEESPLYLGLTIGLRIFGPALGFLLGSFCIRIDVNWLTLDNLSSPYHPLDSNSGVGAWWLGSIIISLPLLTLALPMYYLSHSSSFNGSPSSDEFEDITYQAAEDHDIGGSRDFQHPHVLTIGDLDVTSNRTCYSEVVDSSSREVLQAKNLHASPAFRYNFGNNIALDQPVITRESILNNIKDEPEEAWGTSCVIVSHCGGLESTSFTHDEAKSLRSSYAATSSSSSSSHSARHSRTNSSTTNATTNLSKSLSRLFNNKLLILRVLSGLLHILPIAGFYTFLPKYLIEQFRIAPSSASAISGLAGILFVGIGAFVGGMIIRVLNVNSKIMANWIASSALLYAIGMLILMNLGCPQNQTVYLESENFKSTDCYDTCHCSNNVYSPVCANGTTFMSPCLAGCRSYTISEGKIIFDECGCSPVTDKIHNNSQTVDQLNHQDIQTLSKHLNLNVATEGHCLLNCDNLIWYIILFSTFTFIHASCEVGSMMFNLRCVKSNDRTLALGLVTFASSLLGKFVLSYSLFQC